MKRILIPTLIICVIILTIFFAFPGLENYFTTVAESYAKESKTIFVVLSFLILSSDFLLPIPSSILMFSNGWILGFVPGFLLSIISNMVSTIFGYYLGRTATDKVNSMYNPAELTKANDFLSSYGEIGLIISRGIPVLSEATSMVCGNMAFDIKKFFLANLLGYIPVCGLYAYLGSISVEKDIFIYAVFTNLVIAGIFWFAKDMIWKKEKVNTPKTS